MDSLTNFAKSTVIKIIIMRRPLSILGVIIVGAKQLPSNLESISVAISLTKIDTVKRDLYNRNNLGFTDRQRVGNNSNNDNNNNICSLALPYVTKYSTPGANISVYQIPISSNQLL